MAIAFHCPACQNTFEASEDAPENVVTCPLCQAISPLPESHVHETPAPAEPRETPPAVGTPGPPLARPGAPPRDPWWRPLALPFVALHRAFVAVAPLFGASLAGPLPRLGVCAAVFVALYAVAWLAPPAVGVVALLVGVVGIVAVTRALKENEDRRLALVRLRADGDPDAVPDLRGLAVFAVAQVFIVLPWLLERLHAAWGLFVVPAPAVGAWVAFAFDHYFLPALGWAAGHSLADVEPASGAGWAVVLLKNLLIDYLIVQAFLRAFEFARNRREIVWACLYDPNRAAHAGSRAVPGLIDVLAHDGNADHRRLALLALQRLAAPRAERAIAAAVTAYGLRDPDAGVRRAAALVFATSFAAFRPTTELEQRLDDADAGVRAAAVEALGRHSHTAVVDRLGRLVERDPDVRVRRTAAEQLGNLNDPRCVPALKRALKDADTTVRQAAARSLAKFGEADPADESIARLRDPDPFVRREAAGNLAALGSGRAVEGLIDALRDDDPDVRAQAVEALAFLGDLRAVRPLLNALDDTGKSELGFTTNEDGESNPQDAYLLAKVAQSLAQLGDPQCVGPLIDVLGDESRHGRHRVAEALGAFAVPEAVEPLLRATRDADEAVRAGALRALAHFGWDERVFPRLHEALHDENASPWLRGRAAVALGELGDPRATDDLVNLALGHPDWRLSLAAFEAVLALAGEEGQPWVERVFRESSPDRRLCAAVVLGRHGDPAALPLLVEALRHPDLHVRLDVVRALGGIGDAGVIGPLQEADARNLRELETLTTSPLEDPVHDLKLRLHLTIGETIAILQAVQEPIE